MGATLSELFVVVAILFTPHPPVNHSYVTAVPSVPPEAVNVTPKPGPTSAEGPDSTVGLDGRIQGSCLTVMKSRPWSNSMAIRVVRVLVVGLGAVVIVRIDVPLPLEGDAFTQLAVLDRSLTQIQEVPACILDPMEPPSGGKSTKESIIGLKQGTCCANEP